MNAPKRPARTAIQVRSGTFSGGVVNTDQGRRSTETDADIPGTTRSAMSVI
jgi:hypothetical protein